MFLYIKTYVIIASTVFLFFLNSLYMVKKTTGRYPPTKRITKRGHTCTRKRRTNKKKRKAIANRLSRKRRNRTKKATSRRFRRTQVGGGFDMDGDHPMCPICLAQILGLKKKANNIDRVPIEDDNAAMVFHQITEEKTPIAKEMRNDTTSFPLGGKYTAYHSECMKRWIRNKSAPIDPMTRATIERESANATKEDTVWVVSNKDIVDTGNMAASLEAETQRGVRARATEIVFSPGITHIGHFACSGCSGVTRVDIPEGVETIGEFALGLWLGLGLGSDANGAVIHGDLYVGSQSDPCVLVHIR